MNPTAPREREPILDVLRGVAVLGILLINVQLMRGADVYRVLAGGTVDLETTADRVTSFLLGWLASGKFVSSFALLFGVGAAIIAGRARHAGLPPRNLLARRYVWLILLGLLHMFLLFPGDILFTYGIAGMVLLVFVDLRPRTAMMVAAGSIALYTLFMIGNAALAASMTTGDGGMAGPVGDFFATRADHAVEAYQHGGIGDVLAANAWQALAVQSSQLFVLPWILGMFLVGLAVTRAGWVADLAAHRDQLRRTAVVGLAVGLPLNLAVGAAGPLGVGTAAAGAATGLAVLGALGSAIGGPLLAAGYLAGVTLLCLRWHPSALLAATGRMALTAYLTQSLAAVVVFAGFGLYDDLTTFSSLAVVIGIWALVLGMCPLWLSRFRMGPVEWLWRWATYGSRPRLRRAAAGAHAA